MKRLKYLWKFLTCKSIVLLYSDEKITVEFELPKRTSCIAYNADVTIYTKYGFMSKGDIKDLRPDNVVTFPVE